MSIKYKGKTVAGGAGKDATINGENTLEIVEGDGIHIEQQDGTMTISATGGAGENTSGGVPSGCILIWSGASNNVPDGWALCNGTNGTPDLRGRFILGQSNTHSIGSTGGSEKVTLTIDQMPAHNHNLKFAAGTTAGSAGQVLSGNSASQGNVTNSNGIQSSGYGGAHENMPPYYTLCYIMKL